MVQKIWLRLGMEVDVETTSETSVLEQIQNKLYEVNSKLPEGAYINGESYIPGDIAKENNLGTNDLILEI